LYKCFRISAFAAVLGGGESAQHGYAAWSRVDFVTFAGSQLNGPIFVFRREGGYNAAVLLQVAKEILLMAELKTKKTEESVEGFLNSIADEKQRQDAFVVLDLMKKVTDAEPKMWGSSIIGFGHYHYKYASGRENDWFQMGFSPRKQNLTLYSMGGLVENTDLLAKLGKHKLGKGCLYINKIADVDLTVLKELLERSLDDLQQKI
jgi:hypothetical protein